MSKEELHDRGWDITYSGPCEVIAWGKYLVHLRHAIKGMVSGYGEDEISALNYAATLINKLLEPKNEVHH